MSAPTGAGATTGVADQHTAPNPGSGAAATDPAGGGGTPAGAPPSGASPSPPGARPSSPRPSYKWLFEVEPGVGASRGAGGRARPSLSPVYRHVWSKDGFPPGPFGATTCYDIWRNSVARFGGAPCLGWRKVSPEGKPGPYTFMSYDEAERQVCRLSAALAAAGLRAGDRVAVYAVNSPEWMLVLQACNRMSYVCVPVYDTLGRDSVQFVINHSGARVLFVASEKVQSATAALQHVTAPLLMLVHWGPRPMGHMEPASRTASDGAAALARVLCGDGSRRHGGGGGAAAADAGGGTEPSGRSGAASFGAPFGKDGGGGGGQEGPSYVRYMSFSELLEAGARAGDVPPQPPQPTDLTTLMYTSGTTGQPKGVQLPHSAVVAAVAGLARALEYYSEKVGPGDSLLSYLPLAHIYDRVSEETCLAAGACIGYWFGDVARVAEDAVALRPSVFIGVPRVYDKVYETVQHRLSRVNSFRRTIFGAMYDRKLEVLRRGARPDAPTLRLPLPPLLLRLCQGLGGLLPWGRPDPGAAAAVGLGLGLGQGQGQGQGQEPGQAGPAEGCRPGSQQRPQTGRPGPEVAVPAGDGGGGIPAGPPPRGSEPGLGLGFLDSLVFGRIRRGLGGQLRLVTSGGAPLSGRVEEFLRVTLGCPVSQGYGLTESCAASFMQEPYSWEQFGSVGPPLPGTEFRLRSVPEMGYLAEGGGEQCELPAGELLLRGPCMFTGYYGQPDLTREALVPDPGNVPPEESPPVPEGTDPRVGRWFCTGDIAALRPDGTVEIVDRIKNMFKLSQGEYISPERLESVYGEADTLEQIWVAGDSRRSCLVAVAVPHRHKILPLAGRVDLKPVAAASGGGSGGGGAAAAEPAGPVEAAAAAEPQRQQHGGGGAAAPAAESSSSSYGAGRLAEEAGMPVSRSGPEADVGGGGGPGVDAPTVVGSLCRSPRVVAAVLQQLQEVGRANHLRGFEIVRAVHLVPEPFTPDNGLLTPTLKLRRAALMRRFRREVDEMYEQLEHK